MSETKASNLVSAIESYKNYSAAIDRATTERRELLESMKNLYDENQGILSQIPYFIQKTRNLHTRSLEESARSFSIYDHWPAQEVITLDKILSVTYSGHLEYYQLSKDPKPKFNVFTTHKNNYFIRKLNKKDLYKIPLGILYESMLAAGTTLCGYMILYEKAVKCSGLESIIPVVAVMALAGLTFGLPILAASDNIHKNPIKRLSEDLEKGLKSEEEYKKILQGV